MVLLCGRLSVLVVALAVLLAPAVLADSPGADEFPYWPASVKWSPKPSFKTCSPTDLATPHGAATWDAQFTSCVYTLAYFDTCADDACVDAFSASSQLALNCSYNGKVGTAQEVEANRLQRCAAARKVQDDRYVPQATLGAPQCSSAQLTTWDANYNQNSEYTACVKALATTTGRRSCSEECQRLLRDAVSDADECLFSLQAGAITQHEWLKYLLVWCVDVRGETLRSETLLFVKGTSAPKPTTPKPTTPEPTTAAPSSDASDADDAGTTTKPPKTKRPSEDSEASSGSQGDNEASAGDLLDPGASQDEESTRNPVASPNAPKSPNYGAPSNGATSRWTVTTTAVWCAVAAATALVAL